MKTKRRLFLLSSVAVTSGIVVAAACSFPDPQIVPDEGGRTTDSPTADTDTPDSDTPTDGGIDSNAFVDVVEPDVEPPLKDATTEKPPVEAGCICDCDEDGFRGPDAAGCNASVKAGDCDDLDKRAFPGAGFRKDQPTVDTQGDWNCDGVTNREVKAVKVNCGDYLPVGCAGVEGFVGDPACGESSTYVKCGVVGIACVGVSNTPVTQGCK